MQNDARMSRRPFRWYFSYRFVDEFARVLADDVQRTSPPGATGSARWKDDDKRARRLERTASLLMRRIAEFRRTEQLNLFQRARLSQRLQDELLSRGFQVEFARDVAMRGAGS